MFMDKIRIEPKTVYTTRLVKGEDLNHHGTLFAGRTAEWFVESGFIAAASLLDPKGIVCLKIHGMHFTRPVRPGQIIKFCSKIVLTGRSSLIAFVEVNMEGYETSLVSGFITFIFVDEETHPTAHNIEIVPKTLEDKELYERATALRNR